MKLERLPNLLELFFGRSDNEVQREKIGTTDTGKSDDMGFLTHWRDALLFKLTSFANETVGPHRKVAPNEVCQVMRIDMAPLTAEASVALEYVQAHFDKDDITNFLKLLLVKSKNPQSAYFDFEKCVIKKDAPPVPSKKTRKRTRANPDREAMLAAFRRLGIEEGGENQNHFIVKIEKFNFVEIGGGEEEGGDRFVVDDKGSIQSPVFLERRGSDKPLRVGRNLDCDLLIKKDIMVSREHGKLWYGSRGTHQAARRC